MGKRPWAPIKDMDRTMTLEQPRILLRDLASTFGGDFS